MLANGFEQSTPQYSWTIGDYTHGYGALTFSCESLQSNVGSAIGQTIAGPVDAQIEWSGTLDEEVTAIFVSENSLEMHMTKTDASESVSVTTQRGKLGQ